MLRCAEKVLKYHRENGTRRLIRSGLVRLKNALFFYRKEVVGCLSVVDPVPSAGPKVPVVIRPAEISDIPELKVLSADYKRRDYFRWINDKYIFYLAQLSQSDAIRETPSVSVERKSKGRSPTSKYSRGNVRNSVSDKKIVGYVCVCPAKKSIHKLVSVLKLKDTDYWAVDAYIHPEYRGKGINSAIASGFLAQAKREGFKRGYGTILFNNNASRSSYAHIGEKEIGIFTTLTILGFSFYFLKKNKGYEEYFN